MKTAASCIGQADKKVPVYLVEYVPVVEGRALGRPLRVLRDTGSNTVIVRRDLVADDHFNGLMTKIVLLDGPVKHLQEATIQVDTPYFVEEITAFCMKNTTYDLLLGNLPGVLAPHDPDPCWEHTSRKYGVGDWLSE
ncbi:hypothetical protein HPB48_001511 [Haemaphysalis longicornis]|uniref:Uncharacterized protein n=1 Tax=Haemaphysalis longicornis TaxID=44386 RepID=A0A9J6H078_HAELO|nr:hypothetical protein HPB48_001511 [Haemaphysalis longicornis]